MTSSEIKKIIEKELQGQNDLSNVYGLNLYTCLIEPIKEKYKSSTDDSITFDLWTVLEDTEDKAGYKITFDESDKTFGLGILTDKEGLMDIGTYGSFLDTLKGM